MLSLRKSAIASELLPEGGHKKRVVDVSSAGHFWRATFFAMGSPCELLCEAPSKTETTALARIVADETWRIEDKFSRYIAGNIVDRINSSAGANVEVDEETARLIDFSTMLYDLSDGRFDITSGALRRAWTFDGSDRIASEDDIAKALNFVGWHKVRWRDRNLRMPEGMEIDLGGVGKEYAVDKAVDLLRRDTSIACLVNFGGDLAVTGAPASQDAWQVGREALQGASAVPAGVIRLHSGALATSGDTRRFLIRNGVRYSHILDPTTGWPIVGAPASVTVAADTCVQAGVLSTLAMLKGNDAEAFLESEGAKHWCTRVG